MPLRKVPNTEDNEKMDNRFDLSVNDSESHYQLFLIHVLTLMKLSIAPIQIVFKPNNRHFVAFFDVIITLLKFS